MATTLLERLFPASEHSNLRVTLKTTASFDCDREPVNKRRKLSFDDDQPIPKRRAASAVETSAVTQWLGSTVRRADRSPVAMPSRRWSWNVPEPRTSFGLPQPRQRADRGACIKINAIQPHLLQNYSLKTNMNGGVEYPSRKRNSLGNIEYHVSSSAMSATRPNSKIDVFDEFNDEDSRLAGLSAISDQVLNGVRLTTHERDLIEHLIPTTLAPLAETDEEPVFLRVPIMDQVTSPDQRVFQGFAIGFDSSEEEDDSSSDFSSFFDLDEASEEKSSPESGSIC